MTFSAITTDESTSTPIEMAMPASDMALAWMSTMPSRRKTAMIRNDDSAARGSVLAMIERRPHVKQTPEHAQRGRDHGLDDRAGDRADRPLDQRSAVVERHDPNAARQAGLQLADLGLDPARDLERVLAVGHQDHAAGDLVAVLLEDAPAEAGAERDVGDLGEPDRASPRRAARPRSPGRGRRGRGRSVSSPGVGDAPSRPTPRTTYSAFPLWTTCPPDAAFDVATASTTSLSDTPKTRSRLGSGTTWYSIGNPPTLETSATPGTEPSCGRTYQSWIARSRPRSSPPPSTVYQKIWPVAAASGVSSGFAPRGQLALNASQPLGHAPASLGEVDAVVEDHADHREADVARRPHHPHAPQPAQAQRERVGHLVLDLARAVPFPLGEDDDLVFREVGDRVDRRFPGGPCAEGGQDQAGADDQGAVADREGDDRVDHGS